jgi:FkbM family methyltransferase
MLKQLAVEKLRTTLPQRAKRALVNLAFNLDRDQFQNLATQYLYAPDMLRGLRFAQARGLNPKAILDIGAYEGNWTKMAKSVWPSAKVTMIEANTDKVSLLRSDAELYDATIIESLLGSEEKTVPFYVMESGSSVLEENSPLERQLVHLTQRPLDDFGLEPDFIKIDVQGYELEVLRGGVQTLSKASAVVIELSLIEINKDCPLLDEALSFMRERGFVAYDVLELHRRPLDGAMNQLDVLFIPEDSPLRADKRHYA